MCWTWTKQWPVICELQKYAISVANTAAGDCVNVFTYLTRLKLPWFLPIFKIKFKEFSRTIRGIFKETTLTQNGTFIGKSKQVQLKFDILTVLT